MCIRDSLCIAPNNPPCVPMVLRAGQSCASYGHTTLMTTTTATIKYGDHLRILPNQASSSFPLAFRAFHPRLSSLYPKQACLRSRSGILAGCLLFLTIPLLCARRRGDGDHLCTEPIIIVLIFGNSGGVKFHKGNYVFFCKKPCFFFYIFVFKEILRIP